MCPVVSRRIDLKLPLAWYGPRRNLTAVFYTVTKGDLNSASGCSVGGGLVVRKKTDYGLQVSS